MRSFLTVRQLDADNCVTLDSGFQYTANALPGGIPIATVNSINPPFCTNFTDPKTGTFTACEEPWLFDNVVPIGQGTPFQPFALMKPDYQPLGHPPYAVFGERAISVYFSFVTADTLEAAFPVGPCSRYGLISVDGYRRALTPVPVGCWPTGPQWKSRGLAIAHVGQHVYSLAGEEMIPPYNLGAGPLTYSYGYGDVSDVSTSGPAAGALLWYEVKGGSEDIEALIASGKTEICQTLNGAPSAYSTAGYKPGAACVSATKDVVTYRLTKMAWHEAGCAVGPGTKFDPASFASPYLEATVLNGACVVPSKLNATAFPVAVANPSLAAAGAASAVGAAAQLAGELATDVALKPFDDGNVTLPLPPDDVAKTAAIIKRSLVG